MNKILEIFHPSTSGPRGAVTAPDVVAAVKAALAWGVASLPAIIAFLAVVAPAVTRLGTDLNVEWVAGAGASLVTLYQFLAQLARLSQQSSGQP